MKTNVIAASAIVALLVLGAATVTFAHAGIGLGSGTSSAQSTTTHDNHADEHGNGTEDHDGQDEGAHFLTVGATLTFANLSGHWVAFNAGDHRGDKGEVEDTFSTKVGNSAGSFTFKVTGTPDGDFSLTITSGKFTINGITYTVSGGEVALNEGGEAGTGTGTASGGVTFEIHIAGIHGNTSGSAQVGAIRLDVTVGKSTYLVILGSSEGVGKGMDRD